MDREPIDLTACLDTPLGPNIDLTGSDVGQETILVQDSPLQESQASNLSNKPVLHK